MKQTTQAKPIDFKPCWYVVDLANKTLGRVATSIANVLRGKNKVNWTPHVDCGDHVIVVNASKVKLTGNKLKNKIYYNHSQWRGGLRSRTANIMLNKYPQELVKRAVKGMLQNNKLGAKHLKKLHIFSGANHNMQAQKPKELRF